MKDRLTDISTSVKDGFTEIYAKGNPPWEIGRPQAPFIEVADQVRGPMLDSGCGTGNVSLYFAERGLEVTGIDLVEEAIRQAKTKAAERGLSAEFLVKDAMALSGWEGRFNSVIDSGLFHIYKNDDRGRYTEQLSHVLNPGGRVFLLAFSDEEPKAEDSGVSVEDLAQAFGEGWEVESVRTFLGEVNPAFLAEHPDSYPGDGPKCRFAVIRRTD